MKNIKFIFILIFILLSSLVFATSEPTDDLVSRYYLNDSNQNGNVTSTGNISDSYGLNNGQYYGRTFNHGINTGATYVNSNATGLNNTGSALDFDKSNEVTTTLNMDYIETGDFSTCVKAKTFSSTTTEQ